MKIPSYKNIKLDEFEQTLEDNFENAVELSPKAQAKKTRLFKEAAKTYVKKNKDKRITIRLYDEDLEEIKKRAREDGLPYQTYLTSLLHKIMTGKIKLSI